MISLDIPLGDDGAGLSLGQLIDDTDQTSVPDIVERTALAADVRASVAALPPRESRVITLRYGLHAGQTNTLQEVAKELRISRERVRQLELRALRLLKRSTHPSLLPWAGDRTSTPDHSPRRPAEEEPPQATFDGVDQLSTARDGIYDPRRIDIYRGLVKDVRSRRSSRGRGHA